MYCCIQSLSLHRVRNSRTALHTVCFCGLRLVVLCRFFRWCPTVFTNHCCRYVAIFIFFIFYVQVYFTLVPHSRHFFRSWIATFFLPGEGGAPVKLSTPRSAHLWLLYHKSIYSVYRICSLPSSATGETRLTIIRASSILDTSPNDQNLGQNLG